LTNADRSSPVPQARVAFVSFRLGLGDGVSVVASTWMSAFADLGFSVLTIAGEGPVDVCLPWLAIDAALGPDQAELTDALDGVDLVVVENLLTIPLNVAASRVVATALRGRPTLLHHHDPPWERPLLRSTGELPAHDPAWRHVTVTHHAERHFAAKGLAATTIYNSVRRSPLRHGRTIMREHLGVAVEERLLLHPVRAIARKCLPQAIALAEATDSTYWLTGPAEDGYGPVLDSLLATARTRVIHAPVALEDMGDAFAACDAVLFPSSWEGFGNPAVEAATHRRAAVVGHYPASDELRSLGFRWLEPHDDFGLRQALVEPDVDILDANEDLASTHLSYDAMLDRIDHLLAEAAWQP
jgi:mannosylglucosylglycerate synthase